MKTSDKRIVSLSESNSPDLLNRRTLKNVRDLIITEITSSKPGTILCLDLTDIGWITSSGADEVFGQALHHLKESQLEVFLYIKTWANNYEHVFNLHRALYDADLPLMAQVRTGPNSYDFNTVGPLVPYLKRLVSIVYGSELQFITSSVVANSFEMTKTKASTYLAKLFDLRLVTREKVTTKHGYEYVYYPLFQ